jgi:hypothetical protein
MGTRDPSADFERRKVVRIVDMHHRSRQHWRGKIAAPSTVSDQLNACATQAAILLCAHAVAHPEGMALAGQLHVQRARQFDPHSATAVPSSDSSDGGKRVSLGFLAPKSTAHPRASADHAMRGQTKHARDDNLGLGGVLCRSNDLYHAFAVDLHPARLSLQIKMILTADLQLTVADSTGASRQRGIAHHHARSARRG